MNEPLNRTNTSSVNEQQIQAWLTDEEGCLAFLFHKRWPDGFQCPYCQWQHLQSRPSRTVICAHCGHPSSITTHTIMHGSKKNLSQWLLAIWWLCANETETSAKNLQRLLKLPSYQTAWTWLQKLRMAMGTADNTACHGLVELGCAPVLPAWEKPHQALVIAAAETILPAGITGRIRMATINKLEPSAISTFLQTAVTPGSTVFAPGLPAYREFDRQGYLYVVDSPTHNPHRAEQLIKGFEIWLNKVHRGGVALKHLQLYLNEFCFRSNSAMLPNLEAIFNLLLQGVLANKPKPYRELVSGATSRRAE
jgi:transposase-like protein